jgi:hypothetical protein
MWGVLAISAISVGPAAAQVSTKQETVAFEIVSVDGNTLVVRGPQGTREHDVPEDFRFIVNGKPLSVHDLKPGMKGTATITTTTTTRAVQVTEVKSGEVVNNTGASVIVRSENGYQMFGPGDVEKRGIKIYRNGKRVDLSELRKGDRLSATLVTEGPPQVMTEQQVQATLAAAPAPAASPAARPAAAAAPATGGSAAGSAPAGETPAVSPASAPAAAPAATSGAEESGSYMLWIAGLIVLVLIVVVVMRSMRSA